jgi:hypothetical protein
MNLCSGFLSLRIERLVFNTNVSNMLERGIISIEMTIELSMVLLLDSWTACSPRTFRTLLETKRSD